METHKEEDGKEVEPTEEKKAKIKRNVRIVSPDLKVQFNRSRAEKNAVDKKTLGQSPRRNTESSFSEALTNIQKQNSEHNFSKSFPEGRDHGHFVDFNDRRALIRRKSFHNGTSSSTGNSRDRLNRRLSLRASTVPDLNNSSFDIKSLNDESVRRQFQLALQTRCHSQPATARKYSEISYNDWNKLQQYQFVFDGTDDYTLTELMPKATEQQKASISEARKQSINTSGLWQLASACVYQHKAKKSNDVKDVAMALLTKKVAIDRMRHRIEKKLDLPADKFMRIAQLRNNVQTIEKRFKSLLQITSSSSKSKQPDNIDIYTPEELGPPKFNKPGQAVTFFRRCGRIVLIVLRWIDLIMDSEQNRLEKELKSFVDIASEVEESTSTSQGMIDRGLSFDKNVYKAKKEISLTAEHRKILTTRWNFRTPEMIQQVMHGLQTLKSLSEYPLHTQEKLCKVAWYQKIGPKKAIVRQGHKAESFYFILSGVAFVKKLIHDPKTKEARVITMSRLTKGQSFGEIGLIFNTLRTATVDSATPMELLVIGKDDFNRIFMKAEDPDKEADHVQFLRQVPILQGWPIEKLKNEPGTCLLHYFKRGTLVTEDGKTSEWLYFIKSGSCNVLKKLKSTKAKKAGQVQRKLDPMCDVILPELGGVYKPRVDTGIQRQRSDFVMTPDVYDDMSKYYDKLKKQLMEEAAKKRRDEEQMISPRKKEKENTKVHLPALTCTSTGGHLVTVCEEEEDNVSRTTKNSAKTAMSQNFRIPPLISTAPEGTPGVSKSPVDTYASLRKIQAHFMFPSSAKIKSEAVTPRPSSDDEVTTSRRENTFVMIELLHPKDSFGINTLTGWGSDDIDDMLNDSPPVSLVSNGAEIVMLSKKVFMKHINDEVRCMLRQTVRAYPKESVMQNNLQRKLDWEAYKSALLNDWQAKQSMARSYMKPMPTA